MRLRGSRSLVHSCLGLVGLTEQIPFNTPDQGLTVNAVHVTINLGITHLDAILGSTESDIADSP